MKYNALVVVYRFILLLKANIIYVIAYLDCMTINTGSMVIRYCAMVWRYVQLHEKQRTEKYKTQKVKKWKKEI